MGSPNVVSEDDLQEPAAVDESRRLEQVLVLDLLLVVRERLERLVLVVLIHLHEGVDDPVVVPEKWRGFKLWSGHRHEEGRDGEGGKGAPREDHHEGAGRRGHQEQPLRSDDVVKDLAVGEVANLVLLFLVVALMKVDHVNVATISRRSLS